jgi:hypothetical protein
MNPAARRAAATWRAAMKVMGTRASASNRPSACPMRPGPMMATLRGGLSFGIGFLFYHDLVIPTLNLKDCGYPKTPRNISQMPATEGEKGGEAGSLQFGSTFALAEAELRHDVRTFLRDLPRYVPVVLLGAACFAARMGDSPGAAKPAEGSVPSKKAPRISQIRFFSQMHRYRVSFAGGLG